MWLRFLFFCEKFCKFMLIVNLNAVTGCDLLSWIFENKKVYMNNRRFKDYREIFYLG